jgi:hypothetical protein
MKPKRVFTFIAVAAATLGAGGVVAHASGQIIASTLYVSTTGLDTNPCSQTQPCKTLQHAVGRNSLER